MTTYYRKAVLTDLAPEERPGVHLCGDMATCFAKVDGLLSRAEWLDTIDPIAIAAITTRAVRLGNDKAAYNSGMGKDEIESDGEDFADDIVAVLGEEEQ